MVQCANDNSCVFAARTAVKAHKMKAVESQHRAFLTRGVVEHLIIRNTQVGTPGLQRCEHIMTHLPQ